jgi:hypothetical protein
VNMLSSVAHGVRTSLGLLRRVRRPVVSSANTSWFSSKDESGTAPTTPMRQHQKYRDSRIAKMEEVLVIEDEEELQPQWKALEHRITKRANKPKGTVRSGRGKRHPSAWDAENV